MKTAITRAGCVLLFVAMPLGAHGQSIRFGDDSSEYAKDGECDDRRFIGDGMAASLDRADNLRDATDCKLQFDYGRIKPVSAEAGKRATQCDAIQFGNNASDYADDGECDDPRFDGPGSSQVIAQDDLGGDATDCLRQCERGRIWLRTAED